MTEKPSDGRPGGVAATGVAGSLAQGAVGRAEAQIERGASVARTSAGVSPASPVEISATAAATIGPIQASVEVTSALAEIAGLVREVAARLVEAESEIGPIDADVRRALASGRLSNQLPGGQAPR